MIRRLDHFVRPLLNAFTPTFRELADGGRFERIPLSTLYYLIATGGAAPFTNEDMTRILFGDDPFTPAAIDRHADALAELLIGGR